jgi:hypothetical protein
MFITIFLFITLCYYTYDIHFQKEKKNSIQLVMREEQGIWHLLRQKLGIFQPPH